MHSGVRDGPRRNETQLGTTVCEVDPVAEDVEDQEALDEPGCSGCSSMGASSSGLVGLVVLVLGVRRRR